MPLTPGTRLGPYAIVAGIGVGGMGEVYRARDSKLNRDVALKVLPELFATDPDRLARFEREARTLALLNHPHIAQIYGVEDSPSTGAGQAGIRALVMEFVEGPTLADRLARGAIPVAEALPIAKQIAEALEAAHEQGIVHRDLKPANVKVRADGTVKVLDFGLAKALTSGGASASATADANAPTLTSPAMTEAGMILGTAAYMSPEQARGRVVDRRADIWAFGVVLFEMLTGRRAFAGDDVSITLANVLKEDVKDDALPGDLPAPLRRLIGRCLDKDPSRRLRDIGEARIQIDDVLSGAWKHANRTHGAGPARPRAWTHVAWASIAVAAAIVGALSWKWFAGSGGEPAISRFEVALPEGSTRVVRPEVSPDGLRIAGVAAGADGISRIWIRSMDDLAFHVLGGTEGASYPFWSPDSRTLGFFAGDTLKKILVSGGPPQPLCPAVRARGGTWGRAGVVLFSAHVNDVERLFQVAEDGGATVVLTPLDNPKFSLQRFPHFLPDGRHFLFFAAARTAETDGVYVGSIDETGATRIVAGFTEARYSDGFLFFVRDLTLMAQPFDPDRRALGAATPVPVASSISIGGNEGSQAYSLSTNGVLVSVPLPVSSRNQLRWLDRNGRVMADLGLPANQLSPRISPDGLRVATVSPPPGNLATGGALSLMDAKTGSSHHITFEDGGYDDPVWSTNVTVVFSKATMASGIRNLFQQPTNGQASQKTLFVDRAHKAPQDVSPDGSSLIYASSPTQSISDLMILSLADSKASLYVPKATRARVSPDGKWLAYAGTGSGGSEIYVQSFPTPGIKFAISNGGGDWPVWSLNSSELFYKAGHKLMAVAFSTTGGTFRPGQTTPLFDLPPSPIGVVENWDYDVTRDGRFLFNVPVESQAPKAIVTLNWKAGLKK